MRMNGINWSELFPTRKSIGIFFGYVSLFVAQGIFITASQDRNNNYKYDTVLLVLLTELLKLFVSSVLYCRENTFKSLITNVIVSNRLVLALYLVPAFLYCLYNNLAFYNLATFDPTTYFILLQLRVVITGVLFQIVFSKYLSRKQWISLFLLTLGCMVKQINFGDQPIDDSSNSNNSSTENETARSNKNTFGFDLSINAVFILIQTFCSCLAGVYNEYLLKEKGEKINIYVQNVFMYLDSILCNALILLIQGNIFTSFSLYNLTQIMQPSVLIVMFINCAIGITTSFFLRYMNSIIKTFASAIELIFTAILCRVLFMIPIYFNTIISIAIVCISVMLYSQSPVVNLGKSNLTKNKENSRNFEDRIALLSEEDEQDLLQMDEVIIKSS